MDYRRFAVRLNAPLAALTNVANLGNDRLLVRVGHPEPIAFVRILPPSYGLVVNALELGMVENLNLGQPMAEILTALASADGGLPAGLIPWTPPLPPRVRRRGPLRLS